VQDSRLKIDNLARCSMKDVEVRFFDKGISINASSWSIDGDDSREIPATLSNFGFISLEFIRMSGERYCKSIC
jgi:hypothetical protein